MEDKELINEAIQCDSGGFKCPNCRCIRSERFSHCPACGQALLHKNQSFKSAAGPLVRWLQKNGCPHDRIIVEYDGAELVSGEMVFSVEVPD